MSMLNIFRIVALFEGLSYILLLFIATPIKYLLDEPKYVKLLGMPHGLLFVAYIILAIILAKKMNWSNKILRYVLLAAIIPFGTFYIEKKYLNPTNK